MWWEVPVGACVLDPQGNEWWVADRRWNNDIAGWQFLLERTGQQAIIVSPAADAPATMVVYGYWDRVELLAMLLGAKVVPEDTQPAQIAGFREVTTSPDTKGHRVPG